MAVVDVIKYELSDKILAGKHESKEIRLGSQLIVYPGQTAFFMKGGQVMDEFSAGTYTITSDNIPILGKILNLPFGGDTPFTAEVWFINQLSLLDCTWGTSSPIQIEDPRYGIIVPVRAYGQYGFHISEPRLFLEKFVGNMPSFSKARLVEYFRGVILSKLTNIISDKLTIDNVSVVNINSHVSEISEYAKGVLHEAFLMYGIELETFSAISVSVNESDPSFIDLKRFKAKAAEINTLGKENYKMIRSFNVLEKAAANEGGGAVNAAMGIGAGLGLGTQVSKLVKQHMSPIQDDIPPIPVIQYYLAVDGKRQGPYEQEAIKDMLSTGKIQKSVLIWRKGMKTWLPLSDLGDFCDVDSVDCPPPIPKSE